MTSPIYNQPTLRTLALSVWQLWARLQVQRSGPQILINSLPKAGTHLITAELAKFPTLMHSRLHFDHNTMVEGGMEGRALVLTPANVKMNAIEKMVSKLRPGQFMTSHIAYIPQLFELLTARDINIVNTVREPRDILVSNMYYIQRLKRHRIHEFLASLPNDLERYRVLVLGQAQNPRVIGFKYILEEYLGWMTLPGVCTVRFEDLVGSRGGGNDERKALAIEQIAQHVGLETIGTEAVRVQTTSVTFRKGVVGNWRAELPGDIVDLFEKECGDVAALYGYPGDA